MNRTQGEDLSDCKPGNGVEKQPCRDKENVAS